MIRAVAFLVCAALSLACLSWAYDSYIADRVCMAATRIIGSIGYIAGMYDLVKDRI